MQDYQLYVVDGRASHFQHYMIWYDIMSGTFKFYACQSQRWVGFCCMYLNDLF